MSEGTASFGMVVPKSEEEIARQAARIAQHERIHDKQLAALEAVLDRMASLASSAMTEADGAVLAGLGACVDGFMRTSAAQSELQLWMRRQGARQR